MKTFIQNAIFTHSFTLNKIIKNNGVMNSAHNAHKEPARLGKIKKSKTSKEFEFPLFYIVKNRHFSGLTLTYTNKKIK